MTGSVIPSLRDPRSGARQSQAEEQDAMTGSVIPSLRDPRSGARQSQAEEQEITTALRASR
ncbi:hypothetical protein MASR1M90_12620 [Desulfovibrionales bacterium]